MNDVDAYLNALGEPHQSTLRKLRATILKTIPEAHECISYRVPAYRIDGVVVAGFAAFKNHLSYLPFSGSVLAELSTDLVDFEKTKSALHFPVNESLPEDLVRKLLAARMK